MRAELYRSVHQGFPQGGRQSMFPHTCRGDLRIARFFCFDTGRRPMVAPYGTAEEVYIP